MVQRKAAAREKRAGPRTKIGAGTRRECQVGDLVHVADPRDAGTEFTALVSGAYVREEHWMVQLAPVPAKKPEARIPRVSTALKNVKQVYRRQR